MFLPLLAEFKRRRIFRALVGYGIAAFAVLQIIEPVMHGLHWPDATLSYVVVALAIGFPIVVSLAWIFDVSAGGIERTPPAPTTGGLKGTRLALVLVAIGLLAATPGTIWYFAVRSRSPNTISGALKKRERRSMPSLGWRIHRRTRWRRCLPGGEIVTAPSSGWSAAAARATSACGTRNMTRSCGPCATMLGSRHFSRR